MTTAGVLAILALYAGVPLIGLLPRDVGSIRLLGPSLLWWYGGVVAPLAAVLIAVVTRRPGRPPRP